MRTLLSVYKVLSLVALGLIVDSYCIDGVRPIKGEANTSDYNVLSPTFIFRVIDTTTLTVRYYIDAVFGYTLRHGEVLLALSSHRWVQF